MSWDGEGRPIVILGAGGHAKVVLAAALAARWHCVALYDDDESKRGTKLLGVEVLGRLPLPDELAGRWVVLGFGRNAFRKEVAKRYPSSHWATVVHPAAVVHDSAVLGEGTVVFGGAILQPDSRIGCHSILNTSSSVDHDCILGDFVHIAPGTHLAGGVSLGSGVFMGIGTAVIPGIKVGPGSEVGAGATVVNDVPANVRVMGTPARLVKSLTEAWGEI